jgi:signal transduction histidine kinase
MEIALESQSDEIKEFAYRTSHDLKSPLSTISGLIDYIAEDIKEDDKKASLEGITKVKQLIGRISQLIDDILNLTKADHLNEKKDIFNFDDYLVTLTEKLSFILQKNDVNIQHSFSHNRNLLAQKTRLTQVLDNLISNSAKYRNMKKDSFISIKTFNDKGKFYIQVEDNGQGIPQEKQSDVFGMFKRFHESNTEGTGLGLYMVKKHMDKMDAHISFESTPAGTTFYLEFPLEEIDLSTKTAFA